MKSIAVIGGSLAGLRAVQSLRATGFEGTITVVGDEVHRPYDRPPLSKAFLKGEVELDQLFFDTATEHDELDAEWIIGQRATALDAARRTITLADGGQFAADGIIIATGSRARPLPGADLPGTFTVRTFDDAMALRTVLRTGSPRVTIVGAGFLGAEIASSCRALGLRTTLLEATNGPLWGPFGVECVPYWQDMHREHQTELHCGVRIAGFVGTDSIEGVVIDDHQVIPTDVLVISIGALPNIEWLATSGLDLDNGVICDTDGRTSITHIVATGDVAASYNPSVGRHTRSEHWTYAQGHPDVAVHALLGKPYVGRQTAPYAWSDQYDRRIQFAGQRLPQDEFHIVEGGLGQDSFVVEYRIGSRTNAVLAVNQPRPFGMRRRALSAELQGQST